MKTLKVLALSLVLMAGTTVMAAENAREEATIAQPQNGWDKLGSRVVNMQAEHDVITVTITKGFYTKIKLRVMKAPIHLMNINIIFGNGSNKNVVFNRKFGAGNWTRVIDLPGNKRVIKKIKLNYKSVPVGRGRAVVTVFGKH